MAGWKIKIVGWTNERRQRIHSSTTQNSQTKWRSHSTSSETTNHRYEQRAGEHQDTNRAVESVREVIELKSTYVAANIEEDKYFLWSDVNLKKCMVTDLNNGMFCEYQGLIMSSELEDCSIAIVNENKDGMKICEKKEMITPEMWLIETEVVSKWIYVIIV